MPITPSITFITDADAAAVVVARLIEAPFVCLDTEFIREKTYRPEPCLLQAAIAPDAAYLFDLLALPPAPIAALLTAPNLKVMHAARQDMELFYCSYGLLPARLFDTQVAAAVCGLGEDVGYGPLVKRMLGFDTDKSARRTDWKQRPLSRAQMDYAAADVTHLCRIYDALRGLPQFAAREALMFEEIAPMLDPELYAVRPDNAWKRFRLRNESRATMAAVRTLAAAREEAAAASDRARSMILNDEALLEVARRRPETVEALRAIRYVPRNLSPELSELVFNALRAAEHEAVDDPAVEVPELTPVQQETVGLVYALLRLLSQHSGVSLRMYAGAAEKCGVEKLVTGDPSSVLLQGARRELIGDRLRDFCAGRLSVRLVDGVPVFG